jgi:hypothetical protein
MFRFWIHFPPLLLLLFMLLMFGATGGLIHWLQARSRFRPAILKATLAGPTFGAVSVLFALFAGFLLANVVAQKNRALQAVEVESGALMMLSIDSEAAGAAGAAVRETVQAYAQSLVEVEWPQMLHDGSSDATAQALFALVRKVRDLAKSDVPPPLYGQMLTLTQKIAEARTERIAIVTSHVHQLGWTALFVLGFITQFAIGMVNLDRIAGNACAIATFSLAALIALWLIAIQDNPFRGRTGVDVSPLMMQLATTAPAAR